MAKRRGPYTWSRRCVRWYGFKKKCRRVLGVVSESLGTYRAVLRVSLRFQGGECHTSHKADMSRKKKFARENIRRVLSQQQQKIGFYFFPSVITAESWCIFKYMRSWHGRRRQRFELLLASLLCREKPGKWGNQPTQFKWKMLKVVCLVVALFSVMFRETEKSLPKRSCFRCVMKAKCTQVSRGKWNVMRFFCVAVCLRHMTFWCTGSN